MQFKSDLEWESDYEKYRFSFKEWGNFLNFFRLDPDMMVTVPARGYDEKGERVTERKIRLRDLPKHKSGAGAVRFSIRTRNKLVKFDASGAVFQPKGE
jgi:hypothetical protein